jgi:hypothetical protein
MCPLLWIEGPGWSTKSRGFLAKDVAQQTDSKPETNWIRRIGEVVLPWFDVGWILTRLAVPRAGYN